ncbi:hypothetical protein ACIBAC_11475 [Streptomyces sp. NPDC051362]|uniref:hypothetical protein n=1 Tax=Streptomyces sp. NPDC051362 TaxID=3365651 RepID=UPI0037B4C624
MGVYDVTQANRLRWQRLAHEQVGRFLTDAPEHNLPAITWTVATTGAITGRVDGLGVTPEQQRTAFEAWAAYLNVTPTERDHRDGSVTLHAHFERGLGVGGALRADIAPPMTDEDGE